MTKKHNKLYYEQGRNGYTPSDTWQNEVIEDKDTNTLNIGFFIFNLI